MCVYAWMCSYSIQTWAMIVHAVLSFKFWRLAVITWAPSSSKTLISSCNINLFMLTSIIRFISMIESREWILSFGKRDEDPSERFPGTSPPNNDFFFSFKYFTFSFILIMYDVASSISWGTGNCWCQYNKSHTHTHILLKCFLFAWMCL